MYKPGIDRYKPVNDKEFAKREDRIFRNIWNEDEMTQQWKFFCNFTINVWCDGVQWK